MIIFCEKYLYYDNIITKKPGNWKLQMEFQLWESGSSNILIEFFNIMSSCKMPNVLLTSEDAFKCKLEETNVCS